MIKSILGLVLILTWSSIGNARRFRRDALPQKITIQVTEADQAEKQNLTCRGDLTIVLRVLEPTLEILEYQPKSDCPVTDKILSKRPLQIKDMKIQSDENGDWFIDVRADNGTLQAQLHISPHVKDGYITRINLVVDENGSLSVIPYWYNNLLKLQ